MKKTLIALAAAMMAALSYNAQAQSLTDLLKGTKVGDVVNAVTTAVGVATNTVSLPGTWVYNGAAVDLKSDNTLSNLAGTAVTSGVEKKINSAFEKVGIKEGAVKFVFNDGMSFTCTIFGKTLNGTWKQNTEENKLTLQFGQNMKYLSITGYTKMSVNGLEILFDANRFLSFMKTVMAVAGKSSSTVSAISGISNSYDGMRLGFKLEKQ
ncbi:MAG: lipocalin-like domain-containing protein [Candidatus Cryptobacteroides sp.]